MDLTTIFRDLRLWWDCWFTMIFRCHNIPYSQYLHKWNSHGLYLNPRYRRFETNEGFLGILWSSLSLSLASVVATLSIDGWAKWISSELELPWGGLVKSTVWSSILFFHVAFGERVEANNGSKDGPLSCYSWLYHPHYRNHLWDHQRTIHVAVVIYIWLHFNNERVEECRQDNNPMVT